MGLLVEGSPLDWEDALAWLEHVRAHGIDQFLHVFRRVKDIEGDELKWGDELEYGVFRMDAARRAPLLSLRGAEILAELRAKEERSRLAHQSSSKSSNSSSSGGAAVDGCSWVPEYGAWMIEGTPSAPYGGFTTDLRKVEANMRLRRARLLEVLREDEIAPTVTAFPMMGVHEFTWPPTQPRGAVAESDYVSDAVINPHPRFATLTRNIRKRRTRRVDIRVPVFRDVYTPMPSVKEESVHGGDDVWNAEKSRPLYESKRALSSSSLTEDAGSSSSSSSDDDVLPRAAPPRNDSDEGEHAPRHRKSSAVTAPPPPVEPYPGFIHMDCMAFGMGMCCLQVTFQAKNIGESRHLYDHLGVLSPILLALTAATPILKGRLADTDVRWATISASVDDRTPQELGEAEPPSDAETQAKYAKMAGGGVKRLPKSRYEGISTYICNHNDGKDPHTRTDTYNDVEVPYDPASFETLTANGVDRLLALHVSHLFIRDPLVIYKQRLHLDNERETDHFENIQSTNWQTVRWKPPPPLPANATETDQHVGWRTEFRSMEIQLTDFENAAFTVFIALVSRVILTFDLNLYIPLSRVNENMEAAHRVNAVMDEKFYFRSHLAPPEAGDCSSKSGCCSLHEDPDRCEPMTIAEIMLGKGTYFTGLIPLCYAYLDYIECDEATRTIVSRYLSLIGKRASGELPTTATWMRRFVRSHPDYAHDSVVSPGIAFDLLHECQQIGEGVKQCPELLGDFKIEPVRGGAAYQVALKSDGLEASKRQLLLQRYLGRTTTGGSCSHSH